MQNQHLTPHSIMHIKLTFGSREKKKNKNNRENGSFVVFHSIGREKCSNYFHLTLVSPLTTIPEPNVMAKCV